ncbi:MAG: hypothetical protein IKK93_11610 [Campylobacter sp.]|nr:hypothetical protein [Campylobacter sp.]
MNYRKVYLAIINQAKNQKRKKGQGIYYEAHHILPKSLFPLWAKRKSNIVLLTAREHFFCHQLLTKIYPSKKMFLALWELMNDGQNKSCSSKEYNILKNKIINSGCFNTFKGKTHSDEIKEKIKQSKIGKNNPMYGMHWYTNGITNIQAKECPEGFRPGRLINNDTKKKCAHNKNIGKKWFNDGQKNLLAFECPEGFKPGRTISPNKGKTFSDEAKENMSKSHKGKKLSKEHKLKISNTLKEKFKK